MKLQSLEILKVQLKWHWHKVVTICCHATSAYKDSWKITISGLFSKPSCDFKKVFEGQSEIKYAKK